jgi:peptidoglycan/LPS O-acetylase OafA/YrhL
LFFTRLGAVKGGYWFTFALFEFFVLYILSVRFCRKGSLVIAILISIAAFCYDVLYNRYFASMGLLTKALGFLSFMTWRYYLFFFLGTLAKRHFDTFLRWTSHWWVIGGVVAGFAGIALSSSSGSIPLGYLVFAFGGILGMVMVFCLFRAHASFFSKEHAIGRCLQFVGTRTLDIYLLHYFFLPRFLLPWGKQLQAYNSPVLEFAVALILALAVTSLCLLASHVIRLSPFLAHYLFGVQRKSN